MYQFLSRFPTVIYDGKFATNITTRVKFKEIAKKRKVTFYPYTIKEGERPDQIADFYYKDPRYSWLVFLSNDIVDPYYDWYMEDNVFKDYIIKKYGSIEKAIKTILFWRVNWYKDDRVLSPGQYNTLPSVAKKYWAPLIGYNNQVANYRRKELNHVRETNKTQEVFVSNTSLFAAGNIVKQSNTSAQIAQATIKHVDEGKLIIQHVGGAFVPTQGANGALVVDGTNVNSSIQSISTVVTAIPESLLSYWDPVDAYSNERGINDSKKHIQLLDKSYVNQIEKELDLLL